MSFQQNTPPTPQSLADAMNSDLNQAYVEVMRVRMGEEIMLIPVPDVSEIVHPKKLTPVPMAPNHLLGVCNIRGQVVCVVDPCQIISLPHRHETTDTSVRFVVLSHPKMHLALRVDEVLSIEPILEDDFIQATQHPENFFYPSFNLKNQDYRILYTKAFFK